MRKTTTEEKLAICIKFIESIKDRDFTDTWDEECIDNQGVEDFKDEAWKVLASITD